MELIADSREHKLRPSIEHFCKQNNIDLKIKQLPNSDYIFIEEGKTVNFERKRIDDFISSVKNGKIFRQVSDMDGDFNFVLITGFKDTENYLYRINNLTNRKIYRTDLISAISRLNTMCDACIVQWNYNIPDDLLFMRKQAEKCFNTNVHYGVFSDKKKTENPAVNYLASIKGVSYKKSLSICEAYNCNSLVDLLGLTTSALCKVDGIGEKTAKKIIMSIGS